MNKERNKFIMDNIDLLPIGEKESIFRKIYYLKFQKETGLTVQENGFVESLEGYYLNPNLSIEINLKQINEQGSK
jgi:hypothetical protein